MSLIKTSQGGKCCKIQGKKMLSPYNVVQIQNVILFFTSIGYFNKLKTF